MDYLPHQQRVVDEHADIGDRLGKLNAFIGSYKFSDVIGPERAMLTVQAGHMTAYWMTLGDRIALWKSHEPVPATGAAEA